MVLKAFILKALISRTVQVDLPGDGDGGLTTVIYGFRSPSSPFFFDAYSDAHHDEPDRREITLLQGRPGILFSKFPRPVYDHFFQSNETA